MACIVPVCSIAREKSERITRAEIEQKSADEFINGLMSRMTVDEKIGQLNLPSYGNVMPNPKKSEIASRIVRGEVGGIFNIFGVDAIRQLQEVAVKESRLGIPIIVGADICNGYKTVFPIPLGLSCSWKPENIEEVARISAKEVGADGICWTYSPMVDIYHDARWGRVKEGAGEDPFLGGIMAQAWVRGYQGNDPVYEANFTDQNRSTRDDRSDEQLIAEALKVVEGADVIIAALGESIDMSGEGASRAILEMPQTQKKLLDAIQKTGKPIVMVLFTGRPLALQSEEKQVNAILNVWFGGTEAGAAIADVLTGKVSPTGKLTMSFPRVTGQCPIYYNHKMTGRPMSPDAWYTRYVSNYIDVLNEPLYPFGYGLSYTTYTYGDVSLNMNSMDANGKIQASVIVTNTGAQDGEEIVQLYLRDIVRSITPPVQELKGFKRVALKAGESKKVTFDIDVDMLKFYDSTLDYVAEQGEFQVMIGGNSKEVKTASFTLK